MYINKRKERLNTSKAEAERTMRCTGHPAQNRKAFLDELLLVSAPPLVKSLRFIGGLDKDSESKGCVDRRKMDTRVPKFDTFKVDAPRRSDFGQNVWTRVNAFTSRIQT